MWSLFSAVTLNDKPILSRYQRAVQGDGGKAGERGIVIGIGGEGAGEIG